MTLDTQASIQGNQTANSVPSGLSQHMKMTEAGEAVLSFGVSDIQDISMNSAGALVIKFANGSGMETLEISDFKNMAGKQACIKLADGAEIDSHVLYDDLCNQNGICTIEKPQAGATLDVLLQGDKKYDLKFDLADGREIFHEKQVAGEKLILTFTDGAKIVFQTAADIIKAAFEGQTQEGVQAASLKEAGSSEFLSALEVIEKLALRMKVLEQQYADSEGTSPEVEAELAAVQSELADQLSGLEPASGEEGTADDILGSREIICEEPQGAQKHAANESGEEDLAGKLAEIVPAAGESGAAGGISGGGYGFQSQFSARPVGPLDDVGPIDPTALQYGVDHRRDDVFPRDEAEPETPPVIPPDDKPEIAGDAKTVDETDGFALSTSGILNFDFGDDGAGDIAPDGNIAVSGSLTGGSLQSGGHVVTIIATASGYEGTANGQSVFTLVIDPATGIYTYTQLLPFDHADGNDANDVITLDFGVRIADSDGDIAQSTITINVLDDAPSCISSDLKWIDESDMSPTASVSGQLRADFGNDGAGTFSGNGAVPSTGLTSQGETVNVVYDPVTGAYIGATATSTIFILQISGNGSYAFNLLGTLDHPDASNPNDYLRLDFGVRATDFDGDSVNGTLTIKVLDDGPKAADDFFAVDKSVGTITGNILTNDDFSADNDNTVTQVTFGGHTVTVDPVNGANINGSHGTLHIAVDGSYTYTLFSGTKSTDDRFGYTLTDGDGDSSQAKILFEATNGVPSISGAKSLVDETDGFALSTSGVLNFDFGDDGAGNIAPDGHFTASGSLSGGVLSSGGHGVTVVTVGGGYAGIANGQGVFTLVIDQATGAYTYTQLRPFDHADGNNANDIIMLDFGVRIADSDGDTAQASIKIKIADDAPHSIDSQLKWVDESDLSPTVSVSGQLRADFGNDGAGAFSGNGTVPTTSLTSNGENVRVVYDAATGTYTGSTSAGTVFVLKINGNGSYAFDLLGKLDHPDRSNPNDYLRLDFGVRATDFDGDSVNGTLTIKVLDDGPKAEDDCFTVDKSVGTITGNILANDDFSADDDNTVTQVSFNGHTVTVDPVAGAVVSGNHGILNIAADGSYTYTMYAGQKTTNDVFKYTLTDGDGDSSQAKVQFESISGKLIVGKNVDDVDPSKVPHHIGGDDGTIVGTGASDILVGDVGGATLEQKDQDYNFSFILDVSGSMGSTKDAKSKISLLKAAVANLLNELGGYDDGDIKVHFTPFSTTTGKTGTFTVTEADGLDDALEYIDALSTGGYTNYEAPMQDAINWLKGNEPLGGNAINTTYFISDGEPNRYLNNAGNVVEGNVNTVIDQITGTDGTNEVADLKALNDEVIGVGINVSNEISRLNVIDSDGQAINVKNPADLDAVLQSTNPVNRLADVGGDVLQGGDGNDIIYGDSVNTDVLAASKGLAMPQGSGWRVFDTLESTDPNWSREDTENYIRSHSDELAEESTDSSGDGRQGGDDNISGGGGNDTMFGQEGDDTLYGGAGNDIISGGSGADAFLFRAISEGIDIIRDFSAQEGDVLDFSGLIQGFDPTQQAINDFVFAREENGGTIISVDVSGTGNLANAFDLVALEGVQGVDVQTMYQNGNINLF